MGAIQELSAEQQQVLKHLARSLPFYSDKCLRIVDKGGNLVPLTLNRAQRVIHERLEKQKRDTGMVRAVILKGRQLGSTTYIQARFFHRTSFLPNLSAFVLAHQAESTIKIFGMTQRFRDNLLPCLQLGLTKNTERAMVMDNGSGYSVGTAGSAEVGRGLTVHLFHSSETAFYEKADQLSTGLMQTVADVPGTEMIFESTANGPSGFFYDLVQGAIAEKNGFQLIFVPWYWDDGYSDAVPLEESALDEQERKYYETFKDDGLTLNNLAWRRRKLASFGGQEWKFCQEFPTTCVVGETYIDSIRGIEKIEDVAPDGEKIIAKYDQGIKNVFEVETKLGYSFQATDDHKVMLEDGGFEQVKKLLHKKVKLGVPELGKEYQTIEYQTKPFLKSSIKIDKDFGRFLGYFMGDGSIDGNKGTISIACDIQCMDVVEDVSYLVKKYFGEPHLRIVGDKKGCMDVRTSSKEFIRPFFELGLMRRNSCGGFIRKICVPEYIKTSPRPVVIEFIKGLFESDGFCDRSGNRIIFFTKYKGFAKDVQILLLSFGVTCRLNTAIKKAGNGKEYIGYEIILRKQEVMRFKKELNFISKKKTDRLNQIRVNQKVNHNEIALEYSDEVIGITPIGMKQVWDITTKSHTFIANGVVVHNCEEAFIKAEGRFFDLSQVHQARKQTPKVDNYAPLVIGVDQGRTGDDTIICRRQGSVVYPLEAVPADDGNQRDMRLAGRLANIINREKPSLVVIDTTNEHGALDRLHELGYSKRMVKGVHFGEHAIDRTRHRNKRVEMYFSFRDWLAESGVSIPDDQKLISEIGAIPFEKETSNNVAYLVSKDEIKKDLKRSPDRLDSVVLTFAYPVRRQPLDPNSRESRTSATIKPVFRSSLQSMQRVGTRRN